MTDKAIYQKWTGKINEVTLGRGPRLIKIGAQTGMPFLFKEADFPNPPRIAFEVWDIAPADWPQELAQHYAGVFKNPLDWAKKCAEEFGAEIICLRLLGAHPDNQNKAAREEAKLIEQLLNEIPLPLIIIGCGDAACDNELMPLCSQAAHGAQCLLGEATQDNYRTLSVAALADNHSVIAMSPIDINIAKQLNILISDMGLPPERIVINPTIGALGYGLEYAYSIMERARLAALAGDRMLAMPFICFIGQEAWRAKEAKAEGEDFKQWGDLSSRGIIWEATTAAALLQAGADILVMRHPKSADFIRAQIKECFAGKP